MANKSLKKYQIDKEAFMEILKNKGLSIRKLDTISDFNYSSKSVGRALKTGEMSYTLALSLSNFLGVPISSFSNGSPEVIQSQKLLDVSLERRNEMTSYEPNNWLTQLANEIELSKMSRFARIFDESSPEWQRTIEQNMFFIKAIQNYCNEKLKFRGHLFLNEVYDMLGMPRTAVGAVVGWVRGESNPDSNVEFETHILPAISSDEKGERILIDFNVDGVVIGSL